MSESWESFLPSVLALTAWDASFPVRAGKVPQPTRSLTLLLITCSLDCNGTFSLPPGNDAHLFSSLNSSSHLEKTHTESSCADPRAHTSDQHHHQVSLESLLRTLIPYCLHSYCVLWSQSHSSVGSCQAARHEPACLRIRLLHHSTGLQAERSVYLSITSFLKTPNLQTETQLFCFPTVNIPSVYLSLGEVTLGTMQRLAGVAKMRWVTVLGAPVFDP